MSEYPPVPKVLVVAFVVAFALFLMNVTTPLQSTPAGVLLPPVVAGLYADGYKILRENE